MYASARTLAGVQEGLVNMSLTHDGEQARVTISGPDGAWFAVGFDANKMADLPYGEFATREGGREGGTGNGPSTSTVRTSNRL